MTTIAYKDGVLAVDRQGSWSDIIEPTDKKMRLLAEKETAIAIGGDFVNGFYFMDWFSDGCEEPYVPKNDSERAGITAVVVTRNQDAIVDEIHVEYWNRYNYPVSLDLPYDAWGLGAECALGAMYAGANAIDAVLAAGKHLCHTGFGVMWIDFNKDKLTIGARRG